jgi:1-acyl-sn-glycerol-3-phosphate acyltransferase
MSFLTNLVNTAVKIVTGILCKIDKSEFHKMPKKGPLILAANHISFLELPVMFTHLQPRPFSGFAKARNWKSPVWRVFLDLWGAIPLREGEVGMEAFKQAQASLDAGMIFAIAPEGTRSSTGILGTGQPGVALLVAKSGVPILPMAYHGGENFWNNLKKLKRTPFDVAIGNPFSIEMHGRALSKHVCHEIADEIMYQIAALLPPTHRGYYCDFSKASEEYLNFESGVESNLLRAGIT